MKTQLDKEEHTGEDKWGKTDNHKGRRNSRCTPENKPSMETGSAQKTNTEHRAKKTQRTEQKNDHTEGGTDRKTSSLKIQKHKNKN